MRIKFAFRVILTCRNNLNNKDISVKKIRNNVISKRNIESAVKNRNIVISSQSMFSNNHVLE